MGGYQVAECEGIPALQHALYPDEFRDTDDYIQYKANLRYEVYIANKNRNETIFYTAPRPTEGQFKYYVQDPQFIPPKLWGFLPEINHTTEDVRHDLPDIAHQVSKKSRLDLPIQPIMQHDHSDPMLLKIKVSQPLSYVFISQHDDFIKEHLTCERNEPMVPIKPDIPLELNIPISQPNKYIIINERYIPLSEHDDLNIQRIPNKPNNVMIITKPDLPLEIYTSTYSGVTNLPATHLPEAKEVSKDIASALKQVKDEYHPEYHPIILSFFHYLNSDAYDPKSVAHFVHGNAELLKIESSDYLIEHFDLVWSISDKSDKNNVLYHKSFMLHALYMIKLKELSFNFNEPTRLYDTLTIFNDIKKFINFRYPEYPL